MRYTPDERFTFLSLALFDALGQTQGAHLVADSGAGDTDPLSGETSETDTFFGTDPSSTDKIPPVIHSADTGPDAVVISSFPATRVISVPTAVFTTQNTVPRTDATAVPVVISSSLRSPRSSRSFGALVQISQEFSASRTLVRRPLESFVERFSILSSVADVAEPILASVPSDTCNIAYPPAATVSTSPCSSSPVKLFAGETVTLPEYDATFATILFSKGL